MSADFAAARTNMVDSQVRPQDVTDLAVQDAMRQAPRESVLPPEKASLAYADTEIAYAPGRWLVRPRDVAKMLQALGVRPGERALAISAPYAALILRLLGASVTETDAAQAAPATGAYDIIVCEGAVAEVPKAWMEGLADGGRMACIERHGEAGQGLLFLRTGSVTGSRAIFDSAPPFMTGFEPQTRFVF